ncbi:uncharacterized protein [Rutidosis leptorrhynchoides]|uniref:uncharacterized protein n=1 Tax=Rutidosis leptorrhynchoides TaxID=125765 RepID=UPI003A995360
MFRSPRSRSNGRNKGIKIKHVFQISLLLGVSIWLLYQVHHSDDKKGSNITHKLRNVHSKDMYKLGRKDLRPKVTDRNSSDENQSDERGNESEDEEAAHASHMINDHDEVGEIEHAYDHEKNTEDEKIKTEHKGERRNGGKKNEGTKEENGSEKRGEKGKENIKVKTKNKYEGRKNEMKQVKGEVNEDKSNERNKVAKKSEKISPNAKEVVSSSPDEGHDQSVRDEIENDKMTDTSPYSYLVPSFELESANSVNDNGDSQGQDKERVLNERDDGDGSVLEEEKDALTDLGTLPENETGGSISHDDAATE